jgi:hypothetical protein
MMPSDTPEEVMQIQREIFQKKTLEQRFLIGAALIDEGRRIMESIIKQRNPNISPCEMRIIIFKRCYGSCYSPDELDLIILSIQNYFRRMDVESVNNS